MSIMDKAKGAAVNKVKELATSFFNFPQIDSNLTVWFVFEGKEYEVSQFKIAFGQGVDYKGQPQDEVRGGRILLTLTEAVPDDIYKWAMASVKMNGLVEFRSQTTNSPLKVEFMNAYCSNFDRVINSVGGLYTALSITPEELLMNDISFDNHWAK